MKNLLNEYSSELIERINNGSNKFLFIFEKLQAAGIEVVIEVVIAIIFWIVAYSFFSYGISKYESAGN